MNKQSIINNFGWGFLLWLFGYLLSFVLFFIVPPMTIGWVLMPLGIIVTIWVLLRKVKAEAISQYIVMGFIWLIIAVIFDYIFIVKTLHPTNGYYKPSVYIYYALTLLLPIVIGFYKQRKQ